MKSIAVLQTGDLPQISWEISQNIVESHLIVDDLAVEVRWVQRRKVLMGPGMRSNLVSFCNHSLFIHQLLIT